MDRITHWTYAVIVVFRHLIFIYSDTIYKIIMAISYCRKSAAKIGINL